MGEYLGAVADLFSGAGGMSTGFGTHPQFDLVGAADAEIGKPSTGEGAIGCNATYQANLKIAPIAANLAEWPAEKVIDTWGLENGLDVLLACPPCTGFSRNVPKNLLEDDPRNSLVAHVADYVEILRPEIVLMENVPQLVNGKFKAHFEAMAHRLDVLGYEVRAEVHQLTRFGLPQARERALVVACKKSYEIRTLSDLWAGYEIAPDATTVRRAIGHLPPVTAGGTDPDDPAHTSTGLQGESLERIRAIPKDGGSWPDLLQNEATQKYLIPSMWKSVEKGRLNERCDVYGRMAWDRPSPTIKRECSHVGNGRYSHPDQDRQCTVRELALLQGFPENYEFVGASRKNLYRQVGDAVPPIVSFQMAWLASWILTGLRPDQGKLLLPYSHLGTGDIVEVAVQRSMTFC